MKPIVSGINAIIYHLARHLADLLKPMVGKKSTHIQNSKNLVDKLEHVKLEEGEVLTPFDVTALFTSMPGKDVVEMAILHAERDPIWSNMTLMTPEEFGDRLQMAVDMTYFMFNGRIYEQTSGMAMGSPFCPFSLTSSWKNLRRKPLLRHHTPLHSGGGMSTTLG